MMDEWTTAKEKIIPRSIHKCDYHDTDRYTESLEVKKCTEECRKLGIHDVLRQEYTA